MAALPNQSSTSPASNPLAGPILIPGGTGMLARAWRELLTRRGAIFCPLTRAELNLGEPASIDRAIPPGTRLVLNCAAWTDVDGAEKAEPAADVANGSGVGALARRCREVGAFLVHYSTDYVFNGQATAPYRVDQTREPLNAYGRTKAHGEALIEASGCQHLIIRTSWLYAPWGKNFVRTIAKAAKERPSLRVVNDQRGRPTSSEHLAAVSLALLQKGARGMFHGTDGGECTWHGFASLIAQRVNPACRVDPCASSEFPRPAVRPAYSVLDIAKTEDLVGAMTPWEKNVIDVLGRLV